MSQHPAEPAAPRRALPTRAFAPPGWLDVLRARLVLSAFPLCLRLASALPERLRGPATPSYETFVRAQLTIVRASPEPDDLELAALSGALALSGVREGLPPVELEGARIAAAVAEAFNALANVDESDDPRVGWDALCTLDELACAAVFTGHQALIEDDIETAGRLIRAFPEPWCAHAAVAEAQLGRWAGAGVWRPLWRLWAAVAASRVSELSGRTSCHEN